MHKIGEFVNEYNRIGVSLYGRWKWPTQVTGDSLSKVRVFMQTTTFWEWMSALATGYTRLALAGVVL